MANLSKIKEIAESKKISLVELATAVGISVQQIHVMVRTNSTKINTLEKIARKLGVSILEFFDEDVAKISMSETHGNNSPIEKDNIIGSRDNINVILLRQKLQYQETLIDSMRETISSQKEIIEILKKDKHSQG